ncbi:gem (nuclear organelle) associated protein 2 [Dinochytrium kinnereticum]|nr:gem (nuclear organelle) associated protein 2 [Dinochytrium kinnereticum]
MGKKRNNRKAREDGQRSRGIQSRAADDDDGLRRKGLPVDDYMESEDPLPNGPPSSGLEYLRMVRKEADSCPDFVSAPPPPLVKAKPMPSSVLDFRAHYFGIMAAERPPPIPEYLRASPDWIQGFLVEFSDLRKIFASKVMDVKKGRNDSLNWSKVLPKANDRGKWKKLCYGVQLDKGALTQRPESAEPDYVMGDEAGDINEGEDEDESEEEEEEGELKEEQVLKHSTDRGGWYDEEEPMPLLNITASIDHGTAVNVLKYHIQWLRRDDIDTLQTQWIFSLLLRLDTPLFPQDVSILRDLCRKCQKIRVAMLAKGTIPSEPFDSKNHPEVIGLRMIVTIITGYFGQKDLSDDVAERPSDENRYDGGLSDAMETTEFL